MGVGCSLILTGKCSSRKAITAAGMGLRVRIEKSQKTRKRLGGETGKRKDSLFCCFMMQRNTGLGEICWTAVSSPLLLSATLPLDKQLSLTFAPVDYTESERGENTPTPLFSSFFIPEEKSHSSTLVWDTDPDEK